jgi:acetyltransferase
VSTKHLRALFNPESIAVFGASERSKSLGGMVLRNLIATGFEGQLVTVNLHDYNHVHGTKCVKRVSKLPFVPDLAIVCTPPDTVARLVKQLGKLGTKTAMILTGGLSRTHSLTGRPLMYLVRDAARKAGIRLLGPNTIGVMSPHNKLNATYAHMGVIPGKIAFIGQSGTIANSIIDWAFSRGVGFSQFLTLGDCVDIAPDDLIDYLAQDKHTKAILLHIEHIPSPARFISAVRSASRAKLVIAVKSGRVSESQWKYEDLPPGIVKSDPIYDAVFRRAGVLRVNGTDEMFDALETLNRMKTIRQEPLTIISNGLGPTVLAVDKLFALNGHLATLSDDTLKKLEKLLPAYWTRKNPVDLNYDASPELYGQVLDILAQDKNCSNVLVMYAPSLIEYPQKIAQSVIQHGKKSRLNIITTWMGQSTVKSSRDLFFDAGTPTYSTPEKAIKAFMYQVNHKRNQAMLKETPMYYHENNDQVDVAAEIIAKALQKKRNHLTNQEARELITAYGIPTSETYYCDDVEEILEIYRELQSPINITLLHEKSCHPFLEEKTGRGRYKTTMKRLNDEHAIQNSCKILLQQYEAHFKGSGFLGYAVHKTDQHIGGLGFSLGITRDPVFGPLVVCGAAGANVNVISDRRVALPPLNLVLAKDLLCQTYMYQLLVEYSYHPEQDIQSVCKTLISLSKIVIDNPNIRGLEILPLLFNKHGVVAADVAVDLAEPAQFSIQPYPAHLSEKVELPKSGRIVEIRPIRSEDEPAHIEFHSQLSNESIRFRFFHYRKSLTHDELVQMVQIDYNREMAFIATSPKKRQELISQHGKVKHETLGVVRTWTDADNLQAEFAVIIRDDMKGEGLGRSLMEKMIAYCKSRGTLEMIGSVLPNNTPMLKLAEKLGFEVYYDEEEEVMALRLPLNIISNEWQQKRLKKLYSST